MTEHGPKPVEAVRGCAEAGDGCDRVWTRDEHDPDGPVVLRRVLRTFVRLSLVWELELPGGVVVRTTAEHPFWVVGKGWLGVDEMAPGDRLVGIENQPVAVAAVRDTGEVAEVYNFEVEDAHTYFVGCHEWGITLWTHNQACGPEDMLGSTNRLANKLAAWRTYKAANPNADLAVWSKQYDVLRTNYLRGKWREWISAKLGLGNTGGTYYTPIGQRIVDVFNAPNIIREIKNGYVTFDTFVRKQMAKDFWLMNNRGLRPEWHFYGSVSHRVPEKLRT